MSCFSFLPDCLKAACLVSALVNIDWIILVFYSTFLCVVMREEALVFVYLLEGCKELQLVSLRQCGEGAFRLARH